MSPVPDDCEEKKTPDKEDISMAEVDVNPIEFTDSDESDDEDNDEDPSHAGYLPLSQVPPTEDSDEDVDTAQSDVPSSVGSNHNVIDHAIRNALDAELGHSVAAAASSQPQGEESSANSETETCGLWNQKKEPEPLDEERAEEVKKVMANILLPPCNHPEWAKHISEEEWKSKLIPHLSGRGEKKNTDSKKRDEIR